MKAIATPLSAADLIPGPLYIWMYVHPNGELKIGLFTVVSESSEKGKLCIEYLHGTNRYNMTVSFADLGCLYGDAPTLESYSRVFYAEDHLYERLYHLMLGQNLKVWLTYLAIPDPDLVAAALRLSKTSVVRPIFQSERKSGVAQPVQMDEVFEVDYADIQLPRASRSAVSTLGDRDDRISRYRESRRMQ